MTRSRPLAFLDSAILLALGAAMLVAASWTHIFGPVPGVAMIDADHAVAVALAADTGLFED